MLRFVLSLIPYPIAIILIIPTSCTKKEKIDELPPAPRYTITVGHKTITVEVALTNAHRMRGLMFRKSLGPDEGMLFVYPSEETLCFWMKDTYVPLSVAFIRGDGWITQIEDMMPLDLVTHRSRMRCKYALEMPQGWFARNGVKVGDTVKIPHELVTAAAE